MNGKRKQRMLATNMAGDTVDFEVMAQLLDLESVSWLGHGIKAQVLVGEALRLLTTQCT
jgi:hypothetical protein